MVLTEGGAKNIRIIMILILLLALVPMLFALMVENAPTPTKYTTLGAELVLRGDVENIYVGEIARPLAWMWDNTGDNEWLGCLQGGITENGHLVITGIEIAQIDESGPHSALGSCQQTPTFVGFIHPHDVLVNGTKTKGSCVLSDNDMDVFMSMDDVAFSAIQCGRNNVTFSRHKVMFTKVIW